MRLVLVPTGTANVASVRAAFARLGRTLADAEAPEDVSAADGVVLPGVGALGAARARLAERGLDGALVARVDAGRPTLAICVGLQLLLASSEESPGVRALGLAPVEASRLRGAPRLPHFGWNRVEPTAGSRLVRAGAAYFAHSYAATGEPAGWSAAWSRHGEPFVAALERGDVLACQFHPELSGAYGAALLGRWLACVREGEATPC